MKINKELEEKMKNCICCELLSNKYVYLGDVKVLTNKIYNKIEKVINSNFKPKDEEIKVNNNNGSISIANDNSTININEKFKQNF